MGPTGLWVHEDWTVTYFPNSNTIIQNDWKYSAGGLTFGIDTDWHIGCGFGVFNKIFLSSFCGSYGYHSMVFEVDPGVNRVYPFRNQRSSTFVVIPKIQTALGLDWGTRFPCWSMLLSAGFEIDTWFNIHQAYKTPGGSTDLINDKIDSRDSGNLNLYGLTVKLDLNY